MLDVTADYAEVCRNEKFKQDINAELNTLSKEHKLSGLERPKDIWLSYAEA